MKNKQFFQKGGAKSGIARKNKKHKHFWLVFYDTYDKRYKLVCRRASCRKIRELRKIDQHMVMELEQRRKYEQKD